VRATDLLIWGIVVHLVIDWLGQNEWMAVNKAKRRKRFEWRADGTWITRWWDRHPAAYVHAGLHAAAQLLVFPWPAALAIGVTHLLIDTRVPVAWWSKFIRQTQPAEKPHALVYLAKAEEHVIEHVEDAPAGAPILMDLGSDVRIWADQVWHIAVIAALALAAAA
jgi:hypothetical protein